MEKHKKCRCFCAGQSDTDYAVWVWECGLCAVACETALSIAIIKTPTREYIWQSGVHLWISNEYPLKIGWKIVHPNATRQMAPGLKLVEKTQRCLRELEKNPSSNKDLASRVNPFYRSSQQIITWERLRVFSFLAKAENQLANKSTISKNMKC